MGPAMTQESPKPAPTKAQLRLCFLDGIAHVVLTETDVTIPLEGVKDGKRWYGETGYRALTVRRATREELMEWKFANLT